MGEQLRIRRITAYCLLAVCVVTLVTILLDWVSPLRVVAALLFLGTAPGWALISYINVRHASVTWISAVALSVSIAIVGAQIMVLTKTWHPEAAVVGLVFATVALLTHHVVRSRPPEPPDSRAPDRSAPAAAAGDPSTASTEAGPR